MYFQYDTNGTPLGFIYNGTQYLYLTDQMGDVIAITDADGGIIAAYVYDAWGKLLNINYLDEENSEHNKIVNATPLRYRGYYYDNETGYYYLQSRYYDPELCRFISADSFEYINTSNFFSTNAYTYCWNSPIAFDDEEGNTPKLSVNTASLIDFLSNVNIKISESLQKNFEKLQGKFNAFAEKAEFYLQNPDIFINKTLSKLLGHEVNLNFRLIKYIKENANSKIALDAMNADVDEKDSIMLCSANSKSSSSTTTEDNNIVMAIIQGLFGGIILNTIKNLFDTIHINLDDIMNKSIKGGWFDTFKELIYTGICIFSAGCFVINDYFQITNMAEKGYTSIFDWLIKKNEDAGAFEEASKGNSFLKGFSIISALISFSDSIDNSGNGALSKNADISLAFVKLAFNMATVFTKINPFLSVLLSLSGDIIPRVIAMRMEGIFIC